MEFHLFLPQMRLSFSQLVARARRRPRPPGSLASPAWTISRRRWLKTSPCTRRWWRTPGSRPTPNSSRWPPRCFATGSATRPCSPERQFRLDHASGGRYELGIGWGSVPDDFDGVRCRVQRGPREGPASEGDARRAAERSGQAKPSTTTASSTNSGVLASNPRPLAHIPIVIGGAGPTALALAAEHADWWNLHVGLLDRLDELRGAGRRPPGSRSNRWWRSFRPRPNATT